MSPQTPDHSHPKKRRPATPPWSLLRELPADAQLALENRVRRQLLRALCDQPNQALTIRELQAALADQAASTISYQALILERSGLARQEDPLAACGTMRRRFVCATDGDPRIAALLDATRSSDADAK